MRGELGVHVNWRGCLGVPVREHDLGVGVLVVRPQQGLAVWQGQQRQVVAVVAELSGLGLRGLRGEVELGSAGHDGLTPAQENVVAVALGDHDVVGQARLDRGEGERPGRRTVRGLAGHRAAGAQYDGREGAAFEQGAAGDDVGRPRRWNGSFRLGLGDGREQADPHFHSQVGCTPDRNEASNGRRLRSITTPDRRGGTATATSARRSGPATLRTPRGRPGDRRTTTR